MSVGPSSAYPLLQFRAVRFHTWPDLQPRWGKGLDFWPCWGKLLDLHNDHIFSFIRDSQFSLRGQIIPILCLVSTMKMLLVFCLCCTIMGESPQYLGGAAWCQLCVHPWRAQTPFCPVPCSQIWGESYFLQHEFWFFGFKMFWRKKRPNESGCFVKKKL